MIYRLILDQGQGVVDTGANYAGCSRDNPGACDPRQFASVEDAKYYAEFYGETPAMVSSEAEAWDVIEGRTQPQPMAAASFDVPWWGWLGLAWIAKKILFR